MKFAVKMRCNKKIRTSFAQKICNEYYNLSIKEDEGEYMGANFCDDNMNN